MMYWNVTSESHWNEKQKFFDSKEEAEEHLRIISVEKRSYPYFIKEIVIPTNEINKDFLKICLKRQKKDNYPRYKRVLTPGIDEWEGDIEEARGHGESIKCCGNTNDKYVLDPSHLGYAYDNIWAKGSWGEDACWKDIKDDVIARKAVDELVSLGRLMVAAKVHLFVCSGNNKGHTSVKVFDLKNTPENEIKAYLDEQWIRHEEYMLHVYY